MLVTIVTGRREAGRTFARTPCFITPSGGLPRQHLARGIPDDPDTWPVVPGLLLHAGGPTCCPGLSCP